MLGGLGYYCVVTLAYLVLYVYLFALYSPSSVSLMSWCGCWRGGRGWLVPGSQHTNCSIPMGRGGVNCAAKSRLSSSQYVTDQAAEPPSRSYLLHTPHHPTSPSSFFLPPSFLPPPSSPSSISLSLSLPSSSLRQ